MVVYQFQPSGLVQSAEAGAATARRPGLSHRRQNGFALRLCAIPGTVRDEYRAGAGFGIWDSRLSGTAVPRNDGLPEHAGHGPGSAAGNHLESLSDQQQPAVADPRQGIRRQSRARRPAVAVVQPEPAKGAQRPLERQLPAPVTRRGGGFRNVLPQYRQPAVHQGVKPDQPGTTGAVSEPFEPAGGESFLSLPEPDGDEKDSPPAGSTGSD